MPSKKRTQSYSGLDRLLTNDQIKPYRLFFSEPYLKEKHLPSPKTINGNKSNSSDDYKLDGENLHAFYGQDHNDKSIYTDALKQPEDVIGYTVSHKQNSLFKDTAKTIVKMKQAIAKAQRFPNVEDAHDEVVSIGYELMGTLKADKELIEKASKRYIGGTISADEITQGALN